MDEPSEFELARRAAAGDSAACRVLIARHHGAIYGYLARLTHDAQAAEELTCDVFAAAWGAMGSFDGRSALATWLHRIAYTRFIDSRRRLGRDQARANTLAAAAVQEVSERDPFAGLELDERTRRVSRALLVLKDADRALVLLHYTQGLSYSQMALITDEPEGTIKWRISVILKALREELSEHEHEHPRISRTGAADVGA